MNVMCCHTDAVDVGGLIQGFKRDTMTTTKPRLLVKARSGRQLPESSFRFERQAFRVRPLFQPIKPKQSLSVAGGARLSGEAQVAGEAQWYLVEAEEEFGREQNLWDFAYHAIGERLGFSASDSPAFVEPDVLHRWEYQNPTPLQGSDAAFQATPSELCKFEDQTTHDGATPIAQEGFAWFLQDQYSQLGAARDLVGEGRRRVRIAHLDTGYDPQHVTLPAHLNTELQRNFVDGEDVDNAADPAKRGFLRDPGHGTGTLSILAGNVLNDVRQAGPFGGQALGGAPKAEIVPLRVASSVVHFYTSAVARAFDYVTNLGCDVVSMSMGGVASAAWTEAINRAYEAGVVIVCAAGNNFRGLPTRFIVYPARYKRVLAACGVMADGRPYNRLPFRIMQGNWGPRKKMRTALSAYTPNMPWAELGCSKLVAMNGAGTSSATPQIAAAAALWLMHHDPQYDQPWMRVEAVRKALFDSAGPTEHPRRLGRGVLRAADALEIQPANAAELEQTRKDSARFAILRVLTGLGASRSVRASMLELEAAQLVQHSMLAEKIMADHNIDPDARRSQIPAKVQQELADAIAEDPACSATLRAALGHEVTRRLRPLTAVDLEFAKAPKHPPPKVRRLRAFAFDPSLGLELETAMLNQTTVEVPWEDLQPGPVGDYLEVVDIDPASGCAYAAVDLNEPSLLAQQGLTPSEGNPQFHQQMVYAVAMKTITNFERALGRVALWSTRTTRRANGGEPVYREDFVPRLRIYPHALREANAYYSPQRKALLFGYFPASRYHAGRNLPGGTVFTCLSHDVVAHETTHALLDGLHERFAEPSNPDVLAFHEAFADLVALFQHFSFPEPLRHQIEKTRGDLSQQNILGQLAQQFGEAMGSRGALRDALGRSDPDTGVWRPLEPDPNEYLTVDEPHARGAILVAAIFDAFLTIYRHRSRDLERLATGGTGVLPQGAIQADLVARLADEAAKSARHVLNICIRALDYCPPVDITFGEYLRALITADSDLVPNDPKHYRVAFIEAFRRRGIFPRGVRTLSVDSLRWRIPSGLQQLDGLDELLQALDLSWDLRSERYRAYQQSEKNCAQFHRWMEQYLLPNKNARHELGLAWGTDLPTYIHKTKNSETGALKVATEVHSVRPARRLAPDGSFITELVVELTQRRRIPPKKSDHDRSALQFRGGCTLLIDLEARRVRYCIIKSIFDDARQRRHWDFLRSPVGVSLHATYFGDGHHHRDEPFAVLHRGDHV